MHLTQRHKKAHSKGCTEKCYSVLLVSKVFFLGNTKNSPLNSHQVQTVLCNACIKNLKTIFLENFVRGNSIQTEETNSKYSYSEIKEVFSDTKKLLKGPCHKFFKGTVNIPASTGEMILQIAANNENISLLKLLLEEADVTLS